MEKTILIPYTAGGEDSSAVFSDEKYQTAYEILYSMARQEGVCLCRSPIEKYDRKRNLFTEASTFDGKDWEEMIDVRPDGIFDKLSPTQAYREIRRLLAERYPMVNLPGFTEIASSKLETSLLLPQHFKPYKKISNTAELRKALSQMRGERFVLKPDTGSGGEGVLIEDSQKLLDRELEYPLLLQEFIDSAHGIPNITAGYHDLRLVFINDDLIYSYIRVPKEGSLLANVAQGARMFVIKPESLPGSLAPIIQDVKIVFSQFPKKIYTIDIMFDADARPWIVELNAMPGIYFESDQEETRDYFYSKLIQALKAL